METQLEPPLLGFEKTQLYLGGVSRATVKTLHAHGLIEGVKIRGRTMFTRTSLDLYIGDLVRAAGPQRRTGRPKAARG